MMTMMIMDLSTGTTDFYQTFSTILILNGAPYMSLIYLIQRGTLNDSFITAYTCIFCWVFGMLYYNDLQG
jgi:hypothetical protein